MFAGKRDKKTKQNSNNRTARTCKTVAIPYPAIRTRRLNARVTRHNGIAVVSKSRRLTNGTRSVREHLYTTFRRVQQERKLSINVQRRSRATGKAVRRGHDVTNKPYKTQSRPQSFSDDFMPSQRAHDELFSFVSYPHNFCSCVRNPYVMKRT